jgi:Uma2 family endonuclease
MNDRSLNHSVKHTVTDEFSPADRRSLRGETVNGRSAPRSARNRWHNLVATNTAIAIGSRIHGNTADIYVNGMRVELGNHTVCCPDVVIVNGEPSFSDKNLDVLKNPTVIIEIFSNGASSADKQEKLESYLAMSSIKECMLVKADEMRIEHYSRQNPKQWLYRIYNERDDVISMDSINCKVSLAEVYAQVNLKQTEFSSKAVN